MTLVIKKMWKHFFKRLRNIKVRKNNNKKSKLSLNLLKREQGVKGLHNKALKPLIVNLHGLDKCLIVWVWWNPILTLEWIPWNQTSMCIILKWMKILLTCNMMSITSMSNKDIHALSHPLFLLYLHPLLLPSCIFYYLYAYFSYFLLVICFSCISLIINTSIFF